MKNDELFLAKISGENELYGRIRDDQRGIHHRKRLEQIWQKYKEYAPKGFQKKFQIEFFQRWWEMYLTIGIKNLGFSIKTFPKDDRPDILIHIDDTKIWIEANAPNVGTKSDAVPEHVYNGTAVLPMRECLFRFTNAIKEKLKKWEQYIEKGIISNDDVFVIAISACAMNQFGGLLNFPQSVMLRVLAAAGDLAIPLEGSDPPFSKRQNQIYRDSGSPVDMGLFYIKEFGPISGIIYSKDDLLSAPDKPESSFELFINPKSIVEIPLNFSKRFISWTKTQDSICWERKYPDIGLMQILSEQKPANQNEDKEFEKSVTSATGDYKAVERRFSKIANLLEQVCREKNGLNSE